MRRFPRRSFLLALPLLAAALLFAGCDDDDHPTATTQILSSWYGDGNVVRYGDGGYEPFFPPPSSDNSVWVGLYGPDEWRGFLEFPLSGGGGVPAGVGIRSAVLDVVVRSVEPGMRLWVDAIAVGEPLDRYAARSPDMLWSERAVRPLASTYADLPPESSPAHVTVDVTPLVQAAQALYPPVPSVQLRLRLDGSAPAGLAIVADPFDDSQVAPLLQVEYYL